MYLFEDFKRISSAVAEDFELILNVYNNFQSSDKDNFPYDKFLIHVSRRRMLGPVYLPFTKRILTLKGKLDHQDRTIEEISSSPINPEETGKYYSHEVDVRLAAQSSNK
jgi:hypothetical protein